MKQKGYDAMDLIIFGRWRVKIFGFVRSSGSSFVWFGRPGTAENFFGRYRAQKNFKPFFWFGRSRFGRPGTAENLGENLGFRRKSRTCGENLGFWRKSRALAKISDVFGSICDQMFEFVTRYTS